MKIKMNRFPHWHSYFVRELERDVDVSVVITGQRGLGKSTLTMWLMLWTEARLNGGVASVEPMLRSLTWDPAEWISKMREEYRFRAVGFEEFGNAATVEEVNNTINQMLREIQSTNRYLRILKIFNLPGFVHMPPKIRTTTNYWINVTHRGVGRLYKVVPEEGPDQRPSTFYKYHLGVIRYEALPYDVYKLYEQIKRETEQKRYEVAKSKVADTKFKKLPIAEKKRIVAKHIIEMKKLPGLTKTRMKDGEPVTTLRWGIISIELANKQGISVSEATLKRWFEEMFIQSGWAGLEEIAR